MKKINKTNRAWNYLIVLVTLGAFGFEVFQGRERIIQSVLAGLLVAVTIFTRGTRTNTRLVTTIMLLLPLVGILLVQFALYGNTYLLSFTFLILVAMMINARTGIDFYRYYTRWLVFFAATSLLFFLLQHLEFTSWLQQRVAPFFAVDEPEYTSGKSYNILVHNFLVNKNTGWEYYRNSGPFWEPGLFGGFLAIALHASLFMLGKKLSSPSTILLLLAIITTFSTASYLLLFIVLGAYFLKKAIARPRYLVALAAITIAASAMYGDLPFLRDKIQKQNQAAKMTTVSGLMTRTDLERPELFAMHMAIASSTTSNVILGTDFSWMKRVVKSQTVACGLSYIFLTFGFIAGAYYFVLLLVAAIRTVPGRFARSGWIDALSLVLVLFAFAYSQANTVRLSYILFIVIGLMNQGKKRQRETGNDTRGPGNDSEGVGNDSGGAGNDSGGAGNDSGDLGNDSGALENDTRGPGNDSGDLENDSGDLEISARENKRLTINT